jgi:hypothetical protein
MSVVELSAGCLGPSMACGGATRGGVGPVVRQHLGAGVPGNRLALKSYPTENTTRFILYASIKIFTYERIFTA